MVGNLNPERPIIFLLGTGSVFNAAVAFSEITFGIAFAGAAIASICSGVCISGGVALSNAAGASFWSAIFFLPPTLL